MSVSRQDLTLAHVYRVQGLTLASERPLPFLQRESVVAASEPQITVRWGRVSESAAPSLFQRHDVTLRADGTGVVSPPNGLRIGIEAGARLIVEAPDGMGDAELHTWLFGPALAILCHQAGRPPLHAAVVEIDGWAVAIAGDSGAGKSTLVSALLARGHRLVSDDQAMIDPRTLLVEPCFPSMKLWAEPDVEPEPSLRVTPEHPKYHHRVGMDQYAKGPVPLRLIVALCPKRESTVLRVEAMSKPAAAAALAHDYVHRPELARALDGGRAAFGWCTAVCDRIPLLVLHRPDNLALVPDQARWIEESSAACQPLG
ncbi:hypothetical protein [Azospirillum sp.]|uniref:HPr kinase/phosphorylase n=1 Tax=Azospirillum sp. TaxID=34012 RepID=UPI00262DDBD2|nr:hypothetical protein [Azospirillum sp.]